ncbi:endo alpha-1,4 polygalactosaminidase [Alcanivorax sp.]|uniref:bifunctional glycoside hydrolase 114/ polysaccharide deacetylase family protein n=2 Tax=Alcanivorax sp. TaxID=1872427 RepID=UPI0025C7263C|nr:endo alpha-1,4 polygalactosaminidase [Alcanivorax sp.]
MIRYYLAILLVLLGLSASAQVHSEQAAAFYYGPQIPWHTLSIYDFPVVEPDQANGVPSAFRSQRFYAYVSLGEVLASRPYFANLKPEWLLGENPDWGSHIFDLSSRELRDFLVAQVIAPLWEQGYQGFFFDTLDSYQLVANTPEKRQQQRQGLAALINQIARRYPQARFIFNRGFELMPLVDAPVDAIAAESLYQRWEAGKQRYAPVPEEDRQWLLNQFAAMRDQYQVETIAIDYAPPAEREQARELARKIAGHGVIPWVTNPELDMLGLGVREVLPRQVLLVHGGSNERLWELSDAVRYGLMPLQFQGLVPEIRAINSPMPAGTLKGRYAGIVVWLEEEDLADADFEAWLVEQKDAGVPIAMLGHPAVDPVGPNAQAFGFEGRPTPLSPPTITRQHEAMGFELALPKLIELSSPLHNPSAQPWLELRAGENTYTPVATSSWGGYAFQPFMIRSVLPGEKGEGLDRWVLNPLTFIREALQLPAMPIPDVTTENGRRLFFAHMDGDGFPSLAEVKGYQGQTDARVLLEEVLRRFEVPTTISVIEGEVAPHGLYPKMSAELEQVAREMFALPHVEAATHTYSHPFYWHDAQQMPGALYGPEGQLRLPIPDYRMDPVREVVGSAEYINENLLGNGKRTQMVLWSGDTIPTPEALAAARQGNLLNMNGSDTIITHSAPTWTLIKGIGLPKGDEYQVYAPNQNENIYTNEWSGPFYGFERVIETFELTESPHRFKPVNIYYHTYIASKTAALESLLRVYRWAQSQPLHPVFASDYARKVLDFNTMVIARENDGWRVKGSGELRTLRLPEALSVPALTHSHGVAGYREDGPGRYLHLSGAAAQWQPGSDSLPYLQQANARLTTFARNDRDMQFSLAGHTNLEFAIGNAGGCSLSHNGKPLKPERREGTLYHYRSAKHGLEELRLHCSH